MSKQHIETDSERAAREAATIEVGRNNHGVAVYAVLLIDPGGHLVQLPAGGRLKSGWRYATRADVEAKRA